MAVITNVDLRKARDERDLTREQLATMVHVSASTIENWERGISTPSPDDVDNIARALDNTTLWSDWMMSRYTSYARRHQHARPFDLPMAVHVVRHEIGDVIALQEQAERELLDGTFDNPRLKERYIIELKEAIAAASYILELLDKKSRPIRRR